MAKITFGPKPTPPTPKALNRPLQDQKTLFEQLLPCRWRGITFPVRSIRLSLTQDLAEHKYYGVDAASVEATGRASMQVEATIPFYNGIVPGKNESWGVLYPTTYRDFLKAFADGTTDLLQHPELGNILCKPQSIDTQHDANRRDGVEVTARWVETIDPTTPFDFGETSPIAEAAVAALDLDASMKDVRSLVPEMPEFEETFDSLLNKVAGVFDSVTTTVQLIQNKPAQIMHRLQMVQDSALAAKNALVWPVQEAATRLSQAMADFPDAIVKRKSKPIKRATVAAKTTLASLAGQLGSSVDDLIDLNPNLLGQPHVGQGEVVRYYG